MITLKNTYFEKLGLLFSGHYHLSCYNVLLTQRKIILYFIHNFLT